MRIKNTNEAMYGKEPFGWSLVKTLNWYNVSKNDKSKKEWVLTFAKSTNIQNWEVLKKLPESTFSSIGSVCRILTREPELIKNKLDIINKLYSIISKFDKPQAVMKSNRKLYKESVKYREAMFEIDTTIDNFLFDAGRLEAPMGYITGLTAQEKKDISLYLGNMKDEFESLNDDKDGYSFSLSKAKKVISFINDIMNVLIVIKAPKPKRKVKRKAKTKSIDKLVSKLNYLQTSSKYGFESIDVTKIIGCTTLLVFNERTRKVGFYESETDEGLSVKGASIIGFNKELTVNKTVRKPLEIVPNLIKGARSPARKLFKTIPSVSNQMTGRLSKDTLILTAWK